jgi:hypothetical protein
MYLRFAPPVPSLFPPCSPRSTAASRPPPRPACAAQAAALLTQHGVKKKHGEIQN